MIPFLLVFLEIRRRVSMKKYIILIVCSILLITGCSSEETPKEVVKSEYEIGETAEIKGLNITVNSTRFLEGNEFMKPEPGEQWIAIDMTFENTGKESDYIGAILELTLKDSEGRSKDYNVFADLNGSLDGNVLPGEKLSGEISFKVSENDTKLLLYYQPTFSTKDAIKFTIK